MTDLGDVDETLVQRLWQDQRFFDFNLCATDGRLIQILKAGQSNSGEGPDFSQAELIIDGQHLTGQIEIHVKSSDWYKHRHHLDLNYDGVVLHVVFYDDDLNLRTRLQNGQHVPTLELRPRIDLPMGDLLAYKQEVEAFDAYCQVTGRRLNVDRVAELLERLGQERLVYKAESISVLSQQPIDFDQLYYEAVMEGLGYSQNRKPFRELAQRVPYLQISTHDPLTIQAILLGAARLLEIGPSHLPEADQKHVSQLINLWQSFTTWTDQMQKAQWRLAVRPANSPYRRLAAISHLVAGQESFFANCLSLLVQVEDLSRRNLTRIRRKLSALFTSVADPYWQNRFGFGKIKKEELLIGKNRAADLLVNAIFSLAYLWAQENQDSKLQATVEALYASQPKLQDNQVTRQVVDRIFSEEQPAKSISPNAKKQQGMIKLYQDFCAAKSCEICPIVYGGGVD